jgi:hypothetical protein
MGVDWIRTPRPRAGHEAEYARLRAVALAELDLLEGFDSANWYSERHGLDGEELAAALRLDEISVYPGETWKVFLGELWGAARETVRQRGEAPLPEEDRALLALAEIQEVLASLATRFDADVRFPDPLEDHIHNYLDDLLSDCRWRLTGFTRRELHLLRGGWDHGFVWRRYDLAPGIYDVGEPFPAGGMTAEQARAAAVRIREQVCRALRRIVPALRSLDDAGIELEVTRWSEFRWRVSYGMLECCPIEQPAWVDTLDELPLRGPDGEKDPALFTFVRHSVEQARDAFGTAHWMEFWGSYQAGG